MVEIDHVTGIRYRLRVKNAPEPDTLPDSEISSKLCLKEGRYPLVLVVEKPRPQISHCPPPGEHRSYEKMFNPTAEPTRAAVFTNDDNIQHTVEFHDPEEGKVLREQKANLGSQLKGDAEPQQSVACFIAKLEPESTLTAPANHKWYNALDGYIIDLGIWDLKKFHESLSLAGHIGEDARKIYGQSHISDTGAAFKAIKVDLTFGLKIM